MKAFSLACFEAEDVDKAAGQHIGVARVLDLDLAEHLADDDLDVLIGDRHALQAVDDLHFAKQIALDALDAAGWSECRAG